MKSMKKDRLLARKIRATSRARRLEQLEDRRLLAIAPEAVNDLYRVGVDQSLAIEGPGVLANDVGTGPLTAHLFSGPSNGTLTFDDDGSFVYTPNTGFTGLDSFMYWANEGDASSLLAAVTLRVSANGDGPITSTDNYAVDEDNILSVPAPAGVLDNDIATAGGDLTAEVMNGPANGVLTLNEDGSFTYVPNANFNGSDTFTYIAFENGEASEPTTVTINVRPQNDKPLAANDSYSATEDETLTATTSVLANDTDIDGDTLTPTLVTGPQHGTVTFNEDGTFTYVPNANYFGIDGFSYVASDGTVQSEVATVTINIAPVNDAPVATDDAYSTDEDSPLNVTTGGVLDNDSDIDGNPLTATLVNGPANGTLTLNSDGTFTYTPNANFFGSDSFTYTAGDGSATSNVATVVLTVAPMNDPPVANNDEYTIEEDTVLNATEPGVLANDSDGDGDALTASIVTQPQFGTVVFNADGTFSYTPNADFSGVDGFSYVVNDGSGDSNVATVTINVEPVNDAPTAGNDEYSVDEDSTLTVDAAGGILANDADIDNDPLTPTIVDGPQHGTLTLNADGSFSYTPDPNYNGLDGFSYKISDGTTESAVATVSITVGAINDPPVINNDEYNLDEDTVLTVDAANGILANDSDADGDTLTPTMVEGPLNGTVVLNTDGSFTYTPNANFNGVDGFSYLVNDGTGDSTIATVTLNVGAVNDAPIANNDEYDVEEDGELTIPADGILENDTDADDDTLTPTIVSQPQFGTLTLNADGSFTYTPNPDYNGVDGFSYKVSDGATESAVATVTINVGAVNDAPVAADDTWVVDEDATLVVDADGVLANDTDPDNDALTPTVVTGPQHGTLTLNADGSFTYTPEADFFGEDTFTYTVSDGTATSEPATVTITVNPVNDTPVANDDSYTTAEDSTLQIDVAAGVLANDTDADGDSLVPTIVTGPAHGTLTMNADGSFSYTPDANYNGEDTFTYTVFDGTATSTPATVTITVTSENDLPIATDDAYSVDEDGTLEVDAAGGILANDTDADGDTLIPTVVTGPTSGTLTLNADGSFSYVPDANFHGEDSFTYTVTDGNGVSNEATVVLTVNAVNDAPEAADDAYSVDEDGTLEVDAAGGILANDTDADGDTLIPTVVTGPSNGALTLNEDGSFSYVPDANFNGEDSFTYTVTDGNGVSNEATVTITVNALNDVPEAADDAYSVDEDGTLEVDAASGITANDTDADGDALTPFVVTSPANGTLTLNADGSFSYVPNENFHGEDSFTYTVTDGNGVSNEATVTITVNSVNDAPEAVDDSYTVDEDTTLEVGIVGSLVEGPVAGGILGNDTDADGDTLTPTIVNGPQNGELTLNADGSFSYVPNANFNGVDTFTYTVSDGTSTSNEATVTITVNPVNDAPEAVDDSYTVAEDGELVVDASGVLGNDTDVDGDTLSAIVVTGPQNGTLTLNADGSFTYVPNADYFGSDSFTYKVSDGTTESAEATVVIEVTAVNDVPTATGDEYTIDEDTTLDVPGPGVLANDSDPEGDALTAVLVTGPQHGTLTLNADGSFSYTPNANFNGADSFTYKANDGAADSEEVTVAITINPVPDAPLVNDDAYSIGEDTTLSGNVLANDFDPQLLPLTATLVDGPTHGTLTLNADGTFSYVPNANYFGEDSFTYTATNGVEASVVTTAKITVQPLNDTPVSATEAYEVPASGELIVTPTSGVLANDTDADGDTLTTRLLLGPANGTLTMAADGSFTYTADDGFVGEDSFYYQASDGLAYGNVIKVTLLVGEGSGGEENTAPQATGDSYIVVTGGTLTLDGPGVLANDSDADGDPLSAILANGPSHGTLTLNADGSLSYTPEEGFVGEDSFTYKANDGEADSNEATVTITVRDNSTENVAPLSADDNFATSIDTPLNISPAGVLANDTDLNGDTLTALIVSNPTNGTLTLSNDGSFTYTPNAGFVGTDTFTYAANDGLLTGNTATVTITVSSVDNTRPNALNDQYQAVSGSPLEVPGFGLLSNKPQVGVLSNDSDAQGDSLTALLFSGPQNGTVQLHSDGSFTYTPNEGFVGQDSFIYRAFDGVRYSALAAVTIRVMAPPAAASVALVDSLMDVVAGGHDEEEDAWLASAVDALFGSDDLLA